MRRGCSSSQSLQARTYRWLRRMKLLGFTGVERCGLLLEVEYRQRGLICVLDALERSYRQEGQEELEMLASVVKCNLESMKQDLRASIHNLDKYIIMRND